MCSLMAASKAPTAFFALSGSMPVLLANSIRKSFMVNSPKLRKTDPRVEHAVFFGEQNPASRGFAATAAPAPTAEHAYGSGGQPGLLFLLFVLGLFILRLFVYRLFVRGIHVFNFGLGSGTANGLNDLVAVELALVALAGQGQQDSFAIPQAEIELAVLAFMHLKNRRGGLRVLVLL